MRNPLWVSASFGLALTLCATDAAPLIAPLYAADAALGTVPSPPAYLVLDETGSLSQAQLKALQTLLIEHNQATGEQIMVGVFKEPNDPKGNAGSWAREIFESWLAQRGLNKGALLAIFPHSHQGRIESGYGLPSLDDSSNHSIVREFVEPELRQEHVFRALGVSLLELLRVDASPLIESGRAESLLREGGMTGPLKPESPAGSNTLGWILLILVGLSASALVIHNLLAAEAHFTGEGWYRPNPWKLLSMGAIKERMGRKTPKSSTGGIDGDW